MVNMMFLFYSLASCFNWFITMKAVKLSRPLVGSSKNRTSGLDISSNPMEHLFLSPPEIPFRKSPPITVSLDF